MIKLVSLFTSCVTLFLKETPGPLKNTLENIREKLKRIEPVMLGGLLASQL